MAHSAETRAAVRGWYIGGLGIDQACERAGVPVPTARRWMAADRKAGNDWDKYRAASLLVAGGGIEQALGRVISAGLVRCEALLELHIDDPQEAVKAMATLGDTVSKLRAASKGMMPEADRLATATDVLRRFGDFIAKHKPGLAIEFVDVIERFGAELARDYK